MRIPATVFALLGAALLGLACAAEQETVFHGLPAGSSGCVDVPNSPAAAPFTARCENAEFGFAFDYPEGWEPLDVTDEDRAKGVQAQVGLAEYTLPNGLTCAYNFGCGTFQGVFVEAARLDTPPDAEEVESLLLLLDDGVAHIFPADSAITEASWEELGGMRARQLEVDVPSERSTVTLIGVVNEDVFYSVFCRAATDIDSDIANVAAGCDLATRTFTFAP